MSGAVRVIVALVVLATIGQLAVLVRHRRLRAKYLLLWGSACLVMIVLAAIPDQIDDVVTDLGVAYPPALYLLAATVFLAGVCMHFSWELSRFEERARALAEEVALLSTRVDRLDSSGPDADGAPTGAGSTPDAVPDGADDPETAT